MADKLNFTDKHIIQERNKRRLVNISELPVATADLSNSNFSSIELVELAMTHPIRGVSSSSESSDLCRAVV